MVQAGDRPDGISLLPYSIGVLAAFAWQEPLIRERCELCGLLGEKMNPDRCLEQFDAPDVVAFSCYIWNMGYSCFVARRLKEIYPDCVIIFGGHSVPIAPSPMLDEHPYVNYLIHGEGEIPFQELLLCLCGAIAEDKVHNISYRRGDTVHYRFDPDCIVQDYPSPYLSGLMDGLLVPDSGRYSATLETNRGCPFNCAYCDWGLNRTHLRMMDLDKVLQEIEWMGEHHIYVCYGADSNFGMFPQDLKIARKLAEVNERWGYPKKFSVSFSKVSDSRVLEICRILHERGLLAGATLSFQSLNPETLQTIGRRNLSMDAFRSLMVEYNKCKIPTYSELILGLPKETYDSFVSGVCTLIENGQYRSVYIYNLTLLTNSELGTPDAAETYGIESVNIPTKLYYCTVNDKKRKLPEFSRIVVQTDTMSRADWVRCKFFAFVIRGFHSFGPLLYIASYLTATGVDSYRRFYEAFCSWLLSSGAFPPYTELNLWLSAISRGENTAVKAQDEYKGLQIPAEESAFLRAKEDTADFYSALSAFLSQFCELPFWDELLVFQRTVFCRLYHLPWEPVELSHDFIGYFNDFAAGLHPHLAERPLWLTEETIRELVLLPKVITVGTTPKST